jgi:hypothetical protein
LGPGASVQRKQARGRTAEAYNGGGPDTGVVAHIVFSIVLLAVVIVFVKWLMRTAIMCQFCGNPDCKVWDRVPQAQRDSILSYFREHEKREPDTSGIFVCDKCNTVFDDFSGEKANREVDVGSAGRGPRGRSIVTCRSWCKVCNNMMQGCDPDNENIRCRSCGTHYEWRTHDRSGYRFLMPPEDAVILKQCTDLSGSA